MHAKAYPGVREIVADLREFSLAKELRSAYDLFQKAQRDRKMWKDEYFLQGAEQEREKWEAVRSENKAVMSENEALRRELERIKSERKGTVLRSGQ
jgi:hypothetical protein